jgi:hypothetical protein
MMLGVRAAASPRTQGLLKLARLLEMPERELEVMARKLETSDAFQGLLASGVIALRPYSNASFADRGPRKTRRCPKPSSAGSSPSMAFATPTWQAARPPMTRTKTFTPTAAPCR